MFNRRLRLQNSGIMREKYVLVPGTQNKYHGIIYLPPGILVAFDGSLHKWSLRRG